MKKFILVLIAVFSISILPSCKKEVYDGVLKVYSWQDYIDDGRDENGKKVSDSVIELWQKAYFDETGKNIQVIYDTFETNESMLNILKTGKTSYDLVCPSDYMIQKMLNDNMLTEFDLSKIPNYTANASPYLQKLFEDNNWDKYAIGYMWGTLGLIYNPEQVEQNDVNTWDVMWNSKYKGRVSTKDSVRDTYFIGVMNVFKEELLDLRETYLTAVTKYENSAKTESDYAEYVAAQNAYNQKVNEISNRHSAADIAKVGDSLKQMKDNLFGFEVDSAKSDIVTGKIDMNLAWSGDAVYSMQLAEEEDNMLLEYSVPEEGSNIWFDGWVMPNTVSNEAKEYAHHFVNFMSSSQIASQNMNKIGYTTAIAGQEVYDLLIDWYGNEGEIVLDLTYFFGDTVAPEFLTDGKVLINTDNPRGQLAAQFPDYETVIRCGVMEDFGADTDRVLEMWNTIKPSSLSVWVYVAIGVGIVAVAVGAIYLSKRNNKHRTKRSH